VNGNSYDMKAKGVSDAVEGQNSAGHKSQQMQALYRRKPEQVEPPKRIIFGVR